MTNDNVLIITAYPKKGVVVVSYKGQHRRGIFDDSTLRNMIHNKDFQKNSYQFFGACAKMIQSIINH